MDDFSEEEIQAYKDRVAKEKRFSTSEEFLEFSRENFVFFQQGLGMRLQQLIQTEQQFIDYLQRVCLTKFGGSWCMWLAGEGLDKGYIRPSKQLKDRREELLEKTGEDNDAWLLDGEHIEYGPDQEISAWCADYNEYFDKPFEVYPERIKVFKPGDLEVPQEYKDKMPFLARFVSHDTFDRCGSMRGSDLEIIPIKSLHSDVISIF